MNEHSTESGGTLKTVLIVDDDPVLTAIVEMFFHKRGVGTVFTAENGYHGLQVVDQHNRNIDFILVDLNMPELDGIEFLRHLKDRDYRGRIAILSGEQASVVKTAQSLARTHNLRIAGALSKPLKVKELEDLVERVEGPADRIQPVAPVLATVHDLRHALSSGSVVPYYQPKVCVEDGRFCGVEALARWLHPDLGVINPSFFIPMAEQNGLMAQLTDRMLEATISDMVAWRQSDIAPKVSVNLCADVLGRIDFPDTIARRLASSGLDCRSMVFEITERQLIERSAIAAEVLARLRIKGFGISIDDFGTGYSNIEQLRDFPFTELKIDQSFVREAASDQFARTTVETCTRLGRQLDLHLVAEGVETAEDWAFVAQSGIDEVQGFYVAKPMPASQLPDWVSRYESSTKMRKAASDWR